jgi:hypothetical protein
MFSSKLSRACQATEGDLDTIISNPVTSTIPKWRTPKLLRWVQNFISHRRDMKFRMLVYLQRNNNFQ